jgi:hypothetical protein
MKRRTLVDGTNTSEEGFALHCQGRTTYNLHFKGRSISTFNMKAVGSSETSITICHTTWRYITKDCNLLYNNRSENLKSRTENTQ